MRFSGLFALVLGLLTARAEARDFAFPALKAMDEGRAVRLVPADARNFGRALSAFRGGKLDLDETMRKAFGVTRVSNDKGSQSYRYLIGGVPVCGYQVRAAAVRGREILALGRLPSLEAATPTSLADWPLAERAFEVAATQLSSLLDGKTVTNGETERCYAVRDGLPRPAWKLKVLVGGRPYLAVADEGVAYQLDRLYFEVDGNARVYPENDVATPTLADIPLPGLVGNELETEFLKTSVTTPHVRASEPTHDFTYPTGDDRFSEVSSFAHAVAHLKFATDLGFAYYENLKPLLIEVHKAPGGNLNNAFFTPAVAADPPKITIADGDGTKLKNLTLDGDVVSHELGHLFIFKNVTATSGESLVLHEGLADFLVFARSGNACLGDSICPLNGGACILNGQCLRSGELDVKYLDANWNDWLDSGGKLGHLHGQVISGTLWDLKKSGAMPLDVLTKTVFLAISYLPEAATFENWIDSLITANDVVSGSTYDAAIRQAVTARGMAEFLPEGVPPVPNTGTETGTDTGAGTGTGTGTGTGSEEVAKTEPAAPAVEPETEEDEPKKKNKGPLAQCGVVAADAEKAPGLAGALMLFVFFLPLTYAVTSGRASSNRGKRG